MFNQIIRALCLILLLAAGLHAETILIAADPPLPVPNFVNNPGFEEQAEFESGIACWRLNESIVKLSKDDGLTEKTAHSGKYSVKLTGARGVNKSIRQRYVGKYTAPFPLKKGMTLVSGAWSKSIGTIPTGGVYRLSITVGRACPPAPAFAKDTHEWTFAEKTFVLDKDIESLNSLYAFYNDQSGAAYFDDLYLSYGTVQLTVTADISNLKQVCLYDNEDRKIFDSGILPQGTNKYTRTETVRAQKTYYVKAEDYDGKAYIRHYPALDRKVDLRNLLKEGKIEVDANMNLAKPEFPAMGVAGVFDGVIEYGNGVYAKDDALGLFTVKLDRARKITRIGICLKPRSVESAEVSVLGTNGWRKIKDYHYANTRAMDYIHLNPAEIMEAIKVSISYGAGLKALTEIELYEETE